MGSGRGVCSGFGGGEGVAEGYAPYLSWWKTVLRVIRLEGHKGTWVDVWGATLYVPVIKLIISTRFLRFVNWQLAALNAADPGTLRTVGSWSEKTQNSAFSGSCKSSLNFIIFVNLPNAVIYYQITYCTNLFLVNDP